MGVYGVSKVKTFKYSSGLLLRMQTLNYFALKLEIQLTKEVLLTREEKIVSFCSYIYYFY